MTERINIPVWLGEVVDGGVVRSRRVELHPQRGDVLRLVHEVVQPGRQSGQCCQDANCNEQFHDDVIGFYFIASQQLVAIPRCEGEEAVRCDVELGHNVSVEREVEPGSHSLGGLWSQGVVGGDSVFDCN